MIIYIMSVEPYHENSYIVGVYTDEKTALNAIRKHPDPNSINNNDVQLIEWDMERNQKLRHWYYAGKQINAKKANGWNPVRQDWTLYQL